MLRKIRNFVGSVRSLSGRIDQLVDRQDAAAVLSGVVVANLNKDRPFQAIADAEFKVFSQWGEDGIIQYLIANLAIENTTFIEVGIEDFTESNCRFLMVKDNWSGFVVDGSESNITALRSRPWFWRYDLTARAAFVTRENIASILDESGFEANVGILSIDIDGMDYWVAEALSQWRPSILIMEYNAVFGQTRAITVPYSAAFDRTKAHASNLYFGASLAATNAIAEKLGCALVGTNRAGNNAFFVRRDLINDRIKALSVADAFTQSRFRESRGTDGRLTYCRGHKRLDTIRGLPVVNVETGLVESL